MSKAARRDASAVECGTISRTGGRPTADRWTLNLGSAELSTKRVERSEWLEGLPGIHERRERALGGAEGERVAAEAK